MTSENEPGAVAQREEAIRDIIGMAQVVQFPGGGGEDINRHLADKERNDVGNAERFLARHGHDLLYVRDVGWHVWTGRRWSPTGAEEEVKQKAHATSRSVVEEVEALQLDPPEDPELKTDWKDRLADLLKWSVASGNHARLRAMVEEAAPYISVPPEMLDEDPLLLNLENGTLRLEGACETLRVHSRTDRLAKIMNVKFDPDARCPGFDAFFRRVQPDESIRRFLQVWSGYCLTGLTGEQKLIFNYGEGGNGKSVFIDLIAKIMGPYGASLPFASLLRDDRKRGSEATPDLARLPGARLVRASEPESGARFAEATIKAITGGEEITVRHLNQGFFDFTPQFKITLSGNHKPSIRGQDRGIWRRFLLIPWEENIPDEEQDAGLPAKLWAERSGVLNWLLDGVRIWLEEGLQVPDRIKAATEEYKSDSDPLGRFIAECIEPAEGYNVQARNMYNAYVRWCKDNNAKPWTETSFGKSLPERGIEKVDGRIRIYKNVRLMEMPEDSAGPPPAEGPEDYDD